MLKIIFKRWGYVTISGEVKGEINGAENIVVTATGKCVANIKAKRLEISGTVKGDIEVNNLVIRPTGQLTYGKISYKKLILDDGGIMSYSPNKAVNLEDYKSPKELPIIDTEDIIASQKGPHFFNSY